jgi:hypothetical protein
MRARLVNVSRPSIGGRVLLWVHETTTVGTRNFLKLNIAVQTVGIPTVIPGRSLRLNLVSLRRGLDWYHPDERELTRRIV